MASHIFRQGHERALPLLLSMEPVNRYPCFNLAVTSVITLCISTNTTYFVYDSRIKGPPTCVSQCSAVS